MKSPFCKTKAINGLLLWFLDLLGLLYHTRMDKKGISIDAILSSAHAFDYYYAQNEYHSSEDLSMLLQLQ